MRQIPELEFRDDRSMEHADAIGRTLREISEQARQRPLPAGGGSTGMEGAE